MVGDLKLLEIYHYACSGILLLLLKDSSRNSEVNASEFCNLFIKEMLPVYI